MELIAWHFVWDQRFLFNLSHHAIFRIVSWLPSILVGIATLYFIWVSALEKYDKEVTYYFAHDEQEGEVSTCAITKNDDSPFEVKSAMLDLNKKSFSLVLRIVGVVVLSTCLLLKTVTEELWSSSEEKALREYTYWRRMSVVWSVPAYGLLLLSVSNYIFSFTFAASVRSF